MICLIKTDTFSRIVIELLAEQACLALLILEGFSLQDAHTDDSTIAPYSPPQAHAITACFGKRCLCTNLCYHIHVCTDQTKNINNREYNHTLVS